MRENRKGARGAIGGNSRLTLTAREREARLKHPSLPWSFRKLLKGHTKVSQLKLFSEEPPLPAVAFLWGHCALSLGLGHPRLSDLGGLQGAFSWPHTQT